MNQRLAGKIALVTGGGGGIGSVTSHAYAREGAKVAVVDVDGAAARKVADAIVAAGGEAVGIAVDVSNSGQVEAMV